MAIAASATAFVPALAAAQDGGIAIVRDAEAERLIYDYLAPIAKAAGIERPTVQLIPDQKFNAFVTGREYMYINVGAIIASETPNELIGVLAHETAHIADNDIAQLTERIENTKTAVLLAGLVGIGAATAGAITGSDGMGQAGAGLLSGAYSVAERSLLRYQRAEESAADRAAVTYLTESGQSAAGMLRTLQRLADDNLMLSQSANPYLLSHPLPRERVAELTSLMSQSPYTDRRDPPDLQLRHDLVRAKLVGFTWSPQNVARRYPMGDDSLPARYAHAIVTFRTGKPAAAQDQIDALIRAAPDNPFFYELKGQALLESGAPREAIAPLRKAVSLAGNSNLLRILLGQALVATDDPALGHEAVEVLARGMQGAPDIAAGYRALARAYALTGDVPMAQLATAQGLFAERNYSEAKMQAERAQAKLKPGSPAWLRADDIVSYKPPR
jgi:predicted Zn-dependent protease